MTGGYDPQFELQVEKITSGIRKMLIEKNAAYGNAALEPVRVFSRADSEAQILVRIDDKLSRIAKGTEFPGEDTIDDLIGYLVLLKIARARKPAPASATTFNPR